jgi:DNA-binding transcriptional LysR family regulator
VQRLQDRALDALVVDVRSLKPSADLKVERLVEVPGAFMCRKDHPLARRRSVRFEQLQQYPVASTPLSDELARILIERYGPEADPQRLVKLSSEEISHLIDVALGSDAVVLAIRAAGPQLAEIRLSPPLEASARFGLVTVARRSQMAFLSEIRSLMDQVFGPLRA